MQHDGLIDVRMEFARLDAPKVQAKKHANLVVRLAKLAGEGACWQRRQNAEYGLT
jgi:hypothetical protein